MLAWALGREPLDDLPRVSDFTAMMGERPTPGAGQMLTKTLYLSLDPYQWWYKKSGHEKPGQLCHGRTISEVIESHADGHSPGDIVFNTNGWAEFGLSGDGVAHPYYMGPRKIDPAIAPLSYSLGVLGMPGLTAYAGALIQLDPQPGQTFVVSAASGGVGQIAGQLARLRGARVVGIAGRQEKCDYVIDELGFDACVSHLSPSFSEDFATACPDGVDCYFENVGGRVFDVVATQFNSKARLSICGVIAQYADHAEDEGKAALIKHGAATFDRHKIEVFDLMVGRFVASHETQFLNEMADWVRDGKISYREDIRDGLQRAPAAFFDMMRGDNFGKIIVKVADDPRR